VQSLAFPMRLQSNGLLQRQDAMTSVIALLQVMARTPAGSWAGCPEFGLRDLFEGGRQRIEVGRVAMDRINSVFAELGLDQYTVSDVSRELSAHQDIDTYAITINNVAADESIVTVVAYEQ
jgi:hypothetical protein